MTHWRIKNTDLVRGNLMRWKERLVLITGAGGFIGSRLTVRLVKHGALNILIETP